MKSRFRFAIAFLLLISATQLRAQNEINFDDSGYQSVLQRSKKEHKPIFYMLYATWCTHCNKMKAEVFKDTLVTHFMNKNFVCAWQDAEKGEGNDFRKKYGIKFYPTFIFIDENGNELYNISGEFKATDFVNEAKNALTKEKQLPYLQQQFMSDKSNPDKCLAYLTALNKGRDRSLLSPIAHEYLATQNESQLLSVINWKIIANGVTNIQSREFQFVLQHQKEYEALTSHRRVQRKITNIVTELLDPAYENKDTIGYNKRRNIAKLIGSQKNDSVIFSYDIAFAEKMNNWKKYKTLTIADVDKYVMNDAKILQTISNNYLKNIADIASLKYAIQWMQHAVTLNDNYDNEVLLAKLYQKAKDTKEAISWANKAKAKNGGYGLSTKEADSLLLELGQK